jgi:hypothetical protein
MIFPRNCPYPRIVHSPNSPDRRLDRKARKAPMVERILQVDALLDNEIKGPTIPCTIAALAGPILHGECPKGPTPTQLRRLVVVRPNALEQRNRAHCYLLPHSKVAVRHCQRTSESMAAALIARVGHVALRYPKRSPLLGHCRCRKRLTLHHPWPRMGNGPFHRGLQ